jgi:hypothetical protein
MEINTHSLPHNVLFEFTGVDSCIHYGYGIRFGNKLLYSFDGEFYVRDQVDSIVVQTMNGRFGQYFYLQQIDYSDIMQDDVILFVHQDQVDKFGYEAIKEAHEMIENYKIYLGDNVFVGLDEGINQYMPKLFVPTTPFLYFKLT